MHRYLNLTDWGTKAALREHRLTTLNRIGRGSFCAVYDGGDHVKKLTSDAIQYESIRDYLSGEHFPQLLQNHYHGYAGTQRKEDADLYLFSTEKLLPLAKAPKSVRALAYQLCRKTDEYWISSKSMKQYNLLNFNYTEQSKETLERLSEDGSFPSSLRASFEDLYRLLGDFGGQPRLDMGRSNLMTRGDTLVLNDVVFDAEKLNFY